MRFLDPTSTIKVETIPISPVGPLTGARVALVDNSKDNADYLLRTVGESLARRWGVELVTHRKRVASIPLDDARFDEVAQTCQLVLTGLGD